MRNYRDIQVWQRSHQITLDIYNLTSGFPSSELYALTSQMKRSAYSIPMNIAEGCGKSSEADFVRFLEIASGSASELDYQLILARDLKYMDQNEYEKIKNELTEIRKMLTAFIKQVRNRNNRSKSFVSNS